MRYFKPGSFGAGTAHAFCFTVLIVVLVGLLSLARAITLSPLTVQSKVVSFSFDSVPNELFTVQSSSSLFSEWVDAAYYRGTGGSIHFSASMAEDQRFFRVRSTEFQ